MKPKLTSPTTHRIPATKNDKPDKASNLCAGSITSLFGYIFFSLFCSNNDGHLFSPDIKQNLLPKHKLASLRAISFLDRLPKGNFVDLNMTFGLFPELDSNLHRRLIVQ
jgi:hypothetical protein